MSVTLVDTHALLWLIDGGRRLSKSALAELKEPGVELFFSHAGAWEIAIKYGLGKLKLPVPPQAYLEKHLALNRIRYLPISIHSVFRAGSLPQHHRDPFDRLMIAQCLHAGISIISHDAKLDAYGIRRIW